jgi:Xaa-Pro aminopeptidase
MKTLMKKAAMVFCVCSAGSFASAGLVLPQPNGAQFLTAHAPAQDFTECTWNVWVTQPSQAVVSGVEHFLSKRGKILRSTKTPAGALVYEFQFDSRSYGSRVEAQEAAQTAVNQIRRAAQGLQVVCQAGELNPQPRLSGGT